MNPEERTVYRMSAFHLLVKCIGKDLTGIANNDKRNGDEKK